jgi:hypothetical protein
VDRAVVLSEILDILSAVGLSSPEFQSWRTNSWKCVSSIKTPLFRRYCSRRKLAA